MDQQKDHLWTTPKKHAEVDPKTIRDLAETRGSASAQSRPRLGVSKTPMVRALADP